MFTQGRTAVTMVVVGLLLFLMNGPAASQDASQDKVQAKPPPPPTVKDPAWKELIKRIDVGPYELPALPPFEDENYAGISKDYEPFRHVEPYKRHFLELLEYTGPGRGVPEPDSISSVKFGFIGPITPTVSVATGGASHAEELGIMMLRGCQLAIKEANARGGYRKSDIPYELVVHNDNGLWGASGNEIIKMAYDEKVWAILGTIDGANSHIAIRVALKAEIFMMNSGDTDPTFVETNIPWVARCIGDDRQMGYLIADYLFRKMNYKRVAIMRASSRYGRFGVREILDAARRVERPIEVEMAYKVGIDDFSLQLERIKASGAEAVVHWGSARDGARILNQMRAMGMDQPMFACDRCVAKEFLDIAGENAEGVICGYPWNPTSADPDLLAFRGRFVDEFGVEPDTYAAHGYDGMNMLIEAIEVAGLNRAKVRDVIAYRPEPFKGVTGRIPMSAVLDDRGDVFLARVEGGKFRFYSREDLGVPRGPVATGRQGAERPAEHE